AAAHRRLVEEMGFDCPLQEAFDFIYRKDLDQGLTEHELDHVFIGTFNGVPELNAEEAASWKFMHLEDVQASVEREPDNYTEWFKICLAEVIRHRGNQ
ncbi:MAG: NUDIX domain-containing protein, partial [Bacteroidota bacterium]